MGRASLGGRPVRPELDARSGRANHKHTQYSSLFACGAIGKKCRFLWFFLCGSTKKEHSATVLKQPRLRNKTGEKRVPVRLNRRKKWVNRVQKLPLPQLIINNNNPKTSGSEKRSGILKTRKSRILPTTLLATMKYLLLLTLLLYTTTSLAGCNSDSVDGRKPLSRRDFHAKPLQDEVDSIVVVKRFRKMYAFGDGKLLKVYRVALGEHPVGAKHFEGDRKTPEGIYHITQRNPNSTYHKSLRISYPNDNDRRYARAHGQSTGGDVMVHGQPNGKESDDETWVTQDWTWGCIAVFNRDIDELYRFVKIGAVINILP